MFDSPGSRLTVGPVLAKDAILDLDDYIVDHPSLVVDVRCRPYFFDKPPFSGPEKKMGSLSLLQRKALRLVEQVLDVRRFTQPGLLLELIRSEKKDPEGRLEMGGHFNVFWIPEPVVVYEELADGMLHIDPCTVTRLDRFSRVFFEGYPAE